MAEPEFTASLEQIAERIRLGFSARDAAREKVLGLSREAIRFSTNAIRSLHRREYPEARAQIERAEALLEQIRTTLSGFPELMGTGYVHDAQKEYAEACVTLALVTGGPLPDPDSLQVSYAAYLNGMGEAVGELRRFILDSVRRGDFGRCEELLAAMDDIYGVLVTMDFPDALTGGLRRTTDSVRGILEKTRGDLTVAFEQQGLAKRLETLENRLKGTLDKEGP